MPEETKDVIYLDIRLNADMYHSEGTAYYRLPNDFFEFLQLCKKKHGISGFEWNGDRNIGVILDHPERTT